ncbi:MAG: transketolase [Eubacteriales bacterium]|nr:transketolase [Eubacteriales bacterium]
MLMTISEKTVNSIRCLAADTVQKANSGHPGAPIGMAPAAYAIWGENMKHNPKDASWPDRDRFVLSSGHASALIYSLLHIFGYGLKMEDMQQFRQWGSLTPGHPEYGHTYGIETTTGPLGQGVANAVGFAIAETILAAKFNRTGYPVVDHYTYAVCGDGCMMEGISSEAASLAGTLQLGKLILFYDDNEISIEGNTDIAFKENVGKRFEAYNWNVIRVKDGNDWQEVSDAIKQAKSQQEKPSLIIVPTTIGFGCPAKAGKASAHGEPLGADNVLATKKALGMPEESFFVAEDVYAHCNELMARNAKTEEAWKAMFAEYCEKYPELKKEWNDWFNKEVPAEVMNDKDLWAFEGKGATRNLSGTIINKLAKLMPNFIGGSADLAPSNKTNIKDGGDYSAENRLGRNFHFGVREHSMAAICNGIALHGGLRVFCGTFFVFSDYMKNAMRMSAIMKLPVTYVLTHDSIGVGEDGPTHQPVEHLAGLRAIPNMQVFRPCDGHETAAAWLTAISSGLPTCLVLTRQDLPLYEGTDERAFKGGYVLSDSKAQPPKAILMASGSEVEPMMNAQQMLWDKGIDTRVVSVPCMEIFEKQSAEYQESVMPKAVRARVAMEAGVTMPWYRFTGLDGAVIGLDHFGASAPAKKLFTEYGFTAENAAETVEKLVK